MTTKLQIETFESDDVLPLYCESRGQEGPAYLYLDTRNGDVYLECKHPAYSNTWGQDEHNGHVRRWNVPNNLTVKGINELLTDPHVVSRLETVMNGAEEYYDGSNYRTKLTEAAREAVDQLEGYLCDDYDAGYDSLEPWDAAQYFADVSYADLTRGNDDLAVVSTILAEEALKEGIYVSKNNVENVLDRKKQESNEQ